MFSPSAIAIVNNSNRPLLIRTVFDDINQSEAAKLIFLLHASLDIVDEKVTQPTSRDNFLGVLYQCELFKIFGHLTTTKIKILCLVSQKLIIPRENDIRQLLKNVHKAYVQATAMNPFYKFNEPVKSKNLDSYLSALLDFKAANAANINTPPYVNPNETSATSNFEIRSAPIASPTATATSTITTPSTKDTPPSNTSSTTPNLAELPTQQPPTDV